MFHEIRRAQSGCCSCAVPGLSLFQNTAVCAFLLEVSALSVPVGREQSGKIKETGVPRADASELSPGEKQSDQESSQGQNYYKKELSPGENESDKEQSQQDKSSNNKLSQEGGKDDKDLSLKKDNVIVQDMSLWDKGLSQWEADEDAGLCQGAQDSSSDLSQREANSVQAAAACQEEAALCIHVY